MNENELLEYTEMLDMINNYNKKHSSGCDEENEKTSETAEAYSRGKPASPDEGPIPLPTPALPDNSAPASPDEGPLPLPTPEVPAKPVRPVRPVIPVKPVLPPWVDIKPASGCMGDCLPFAYPPVEVRNRDEASACIIYELFAGRGSVLSAFLTCTYDGAYFYDERSNAGRIFKNIALCKENHLNLLALLLAKMGVMPKYHGCVRGNYTWWSGENDISYPTYLKMALLDMIDMETELIESFDNAVAEVRDPYVSTLLRRIVMDDRHHLEVFTELYNKCCK